VAETPISDTIHALARDSHSARSSIDASVCTWAIGMPYDAVPVDLCERYRRC
jgi:hypothetical protein